MKNAPKQDTAAVLEDLQRKLIARWRREETEKMNAFMEELSTGTRVGDLESVIARQVNIIQRAWRALEDAGYYGHDSSSIEDGIKWLAAKVKK